MYQHVILFPNISLLQMPSRTRAHDGARTSHGQDDTPNTPPVPPTLAEAIAALVTATADNTRFLREMVGQQLQQQGGRAYPQGPRNNSYLDFSETHPHYSSRPKIPSKLTNGFRLLSRSLDFSDAQRPRSPCLRLSN
jgi:hypothetical protein